MSKRQVYKYDPGMVFDFSFLEQYDEGGGKGSVIDAGYIPRGERKAAGATRFPRLARPGTIPVANLEPPKKGERCTIAWQAAAQIREMIRSGHPNTPDDLTRQLYEQIGKPDQLPTYYQQTGSCVGNGADLAVLYTMAIEVAALKESESFAQTFMPYIYGRSRSHAGMGGRRGEGSYGTAAGKAAQEDGVVLTANPKASRPVYQGGLTWTASVEMAWSRGDAIDRSLIEEGRKNPVQVAEVVTEVDPWREHIRSGRVGTIASNFGGRMRCPVKGSGEWAVLLNDWVTTWMHQMMCSAWMWHPELGELFYIQNSWSETVHGTCPTGAPLGGFWLTRANMAKILRQGDSVIYANMIGFPGEDQGGDDEDKFSFDWLLKFGANLKKSA